MAGLASPTAGEVFYEQSRVQDPPPDVVYVFQQYTRSLFPWKTVERNVAFGLESKGTMSRAEIAARTRDMIGLVKLTGFERHYPWQLSGGMQQRVAIARALACRPAVLLMDEPFSAVDALTRAGLQELLRSLWRELNLTVVFVTHDVDEGVYLSTRVVALTRAPGTIAIDMPIELPRPRDQIATRALPAYLDYRVAPVGPAVRRRGAEELGGRMTDIVGTEPPPAVAAPPAKASGQSSARSGTRAGSASASSSLLLILWEIAAATAIFPPMSFPRISAICRPGGSS